MYEKINHYASENYAVIYTAENDTTQAVRHMSQHGVKVKALVESGALTIVGRDKVYYSVETTELDSHTLLNLWHKLMLNVKRRTSFKGILAIGSVDAFFARSSSHDKLVKYEEIVGKKFHIPLEAIFCYYSSKTISQLSLGDLVAVLNAHQFTLHRGCHYREWNAYRTLQLVSEGMMSRALAKDLCRLIFRTMRLCYNIDERQIISNPSVLEEMLIRIIGRNAAEHALTYVKDEIKTSILYNNP